MFFIKINKNYYIYCHTNKINGKKYIGQTCQKVDRRWRDGEGYKPCIYFYKAIQKYGWDNFEHEILYDNLTLEEANQLEEELIAKYDTMNTEKGYNLKAGGENNLLSEEIRTKISNSHKGKKFSKEHRENLSKAHKGKKAYWYGKHLPEEAKKKISESRKGKKHSEETKKRLSELNKGKNNHNYGNHKLAGKNNPNYGKKGKDSSYHKEVYCVELNKKWDSVRDCANELGLYANNISNVCNKKVKTTDKLHFIFVNELEDMRKRNELYME